MGDNEQYSKEVLIKHLSLSLFFLVTLLSHLITYVWFCNVWLYVRMVFVMCGCLYVWVLQCVGVYMYGFSKLWLCVCKGFVMCGCVYLWVL